MSSPMGTATITDSDNFYFPVHHAIEVIESTYNEEVSVDLKAKDLLKFGRNEAVGTAESTIMTLPVGVVAETYVSDNDITHFASGATGDTNIPLIVEGHTISGSDLTFYNSAVAGDTINTNASNGQTKTALPTPLARITRVYNNGASEMTGPLYVAEDVTFTSGVPQTASAVHLIVPAGQNQSRKASTSLSQDDYWIITQFTVSCNEKTAAFVSAFIESRQLGKVFRPVSQEIAVGAGATTIINFDPYIIIPPNSDIRVQAFADGADTDVTAAIRGYLAIKKQT